MSLLTGRRSRGGLFGAGSVPNFRKYKDALLAWAARKTFEYLQVACTAAHHGHRFSTIRRESGAPSPEPPEGPDSKDGFWRFPEVNPVSAPARSSGRSWTAVDRRCLSRRMGVLLIGLRKEAGRERTPDQPPVVAVSGFTHHGQRYPCAPSEVHLAPFGSVTPPVASGAA